MPEVDTTTLRAYLGGAERLSNDQLADVLAAERAAQAHACARVDLGPDLPADLAEALHRRVARNLAMRGVPLAVQVGELGPVQVSSVDPEIRRLEAPYRAGPAVG